MLSSGEVADNRKGFHHHVLFERFHEGAWCSTARSRQEMRHLSDALEWGEVVELQGFCYFVCIE